MNILFNKKLTTIEKKKSSIAVGVKDIKDDDDWRNLGFKISQFCLDNEIKKIKYNKKLMPPQSFIEGCILGKYQYTHKTNKKALKDLKITFNGTKTKYLNNVREAIAVTDAQIVTRNLVNTPPNIANSTFILEEAEKIFENTNVKLDVFFEDDLDMNNMQGHLAVNRASINEAMTIKLTYEPKKMNKKTKHHIFVGKGLTYDSGGLSLKPTNSMVNMQADKAGAMTVFGLMSYLSENDIDSKVTAYLALAENMINEEAYRPGDILTMKNGKTVKINNTDAEGRLVLFDNLCLAQEENKNFDTLTSVATLTGSAVVQFGNEATGLVSFNDKLKNKVQKSSNKTGEIFCDAAFHKYMLDGVKDDIADLSNTGTPYQGCQKAGLFLTNAITKKNKNKFIHWDIAGPAFIDKPFGSNQVGGTGFGVRTLIEMVS